MDKFLRRLLPQAIGFVFMGLGWYISIVSVGLDKLTSPTIFTGSTLSGFAIVLAGAYLPQIWIFILNRFQK